MVQAKTYKRRFQSNIPVLKSLRRANYRYHEGPTGPVWVSEKYLVLEKA